MARVCVFCGSSSGADPVYANGAVAVGAYLAHQGHALIYGGASVGLMGTLADAALSEGGEVIGVIPESMRQREIAHESLTTLEVVDTMHERKARMVALSDAFVAMPGGYGTLDELAEVLTWSQLGLHRKPVGLLNIAGYFDPLLALVERAVQDGFLRDAHGKMLHTSDNIEALLSGMFHADSPNVEKWLDR